jgi:thiamine biosynthesis protein ThiS
MVDAMQIQVNGQPRDCRSGSTVADLLRELEIRTERVAVELNLEILDRKDFERRNLQQGDRVEILSFIGGGALAGDAKEQDAHV